MTQIQNNTSLPGALGGLGANNPAYTGRKDGSSTDFSRFLNQSSQQLQSPSAAMSALQAQQQSQQLASQQLQTQQQAQQLQAQQQAQRQTAAQQQQQRANRQPENTAAQDENKLAAKNAAARHEAREAKSSTAPARPASTDKTDAAASSEDAPATDAKGTSAAGDTAEADTDTRVAKEADGQDKQVAKESKDGAATPAEQMLAMLRGEAPAEAADKSRKSALDGGAAGTEAMPAGAQGHGKAATTGEVMRERQQLQRELDQAASGKAGAVEGAGNTDKASSSDALQTVAGGAHEIAQADGAKGPPQSFDALLAAAQQSGAANAPSGADATTGTAAPNVPLSQPLHSPDFAPELSASVSLLIQDGVHEAQLQLNPTEMGPVSINIQLDGQQAQVNFHAQHAATREVLERSLPDLAAALQAQGLTLSGGGVFAQTQSNGGQNRDDGASDGAGRSSGRRGGRGGSDDDGAIAAAGRSERRSAPRGLVDLYA